MGAVSREGCTPDQGRTDIWCVSVRTQQSGINGVRSWVGRTHKCPSREPGTAASAEEPIVQLLPAQAVPFPAWAQCPPFLAGSAEDIWGWTSPLPAPRLLFQCSKAPKLALLTLKLLWPECGPFGLSFPRSEVGGLSLLLPHRDTSMPMSFA